MFYVNNNLLFHVYNVCFKILESQVILDDCLSLKKGKEYCDVTKLHCSHYSSHWPRKCLHLMEGIYPKGVAQRDALAEIRTFSNYFGWGVISEFFGLQSERNCQCD